MKSTILALTLLGLSIPAYAQDLGSFEISKQGSQGQYQVAFVPFTGDTTIAPIVSTNLNFSNLKTTHQNLPVSTNSPQARLELQMAGFSYAVMGNIAQAGTQAVISYQVINTQTGQTLGGPQTLRTDNNTGGLKHAAHVISDKVYELITGKKGDFGGKIAFVEETGDPRNKTSTLKVMDADGQNAQALFSVQGSIFSPTWSPDGRMLAYAVQRPRGLPVIYLQSLGGSQRLVTPFKGNNLGPSFSPDGSRLIFSGSHENNDPAIYELHIGSGQLKKLTFMAGAENSPSYAPDGRSFVFTADNGSRTPQLHRFATGSHQISRLASGMASNPRVSPDGQKIAYVSGSTLVVMNAGGGVQSIAPTTMHESATFSPNGTRLVYATPQGITIRHLGTGQSFTRTTQGRVREPAWSVR